MTLIEPKVELITEKDAFKKIELAGRTCYKSEANITEESSKKFFKNLTKRCHTAMLEHATFVFETSREDIYLACKTCKYLNCTETRKIAVDTSNDCRVTEESRYLISGNLRAINESGNMYLLSALYKYNPELIILDKHNFDSIIENIEDEHIKVVDLDEYKDLHSYEIEQHMYTTMRFTCDRGVTHEIVRHRPFSFAQESTRYVNYNKEHNGAGDIKFIIPANYNSWDEDTKYEFENALECSEKYYNKLIENGRVAQEARAVLPNAVKTEIIITGNHKEWLHFFNLRCFGTTGKPHPDMKKVADMALEIYPIEIIEYNYDFGT